MTKSTIQSLKKGNDGLKSKLEALTKGFKALKELLEKKESTDKTGPDGGPPSPENENSLQFPSDEYDDLPNLNTAAKQILSKLGKELSDISVKIEETSNAVEALQQYSYQHNIKIIGFPQTNEYESSEDTAKLCLQLFSYPGVDVITLHDIDIAHRVQGSVNAAGNRAVARFLRIILISFTLTKT